MFERQAGVPECCDHVRPEVYNENPNIDVTAVRDDTALPEPACRGRERQREAVTSCPRHLTMMLLGCQHAKLACGHTVDPRLVADARRVTQTGAAAEPEGDVEA